MRTRVKKSGARTVRAVRRESTERMLDMLVRAAFIRARDRLAAALRKANLRAGRPAEQGIAAALAAFER